MDVVIPPLGESVSEGVIARWLKQDGDHVRADEPILELETDKATVEIPAAGSGQLRIVEVQGASVAVGAVVARILEGTAPDQVTDRPAAAAPPPGTEARSGEEAPPSGPAVRKLVAEHGIDPRAIAGTGKGGRLTRDDVLRHLEARPADAGEAPAAPPEAAPPGPGITGVPEPAGGPGAEAPDGAPRPPGPHPVAPAGAGETVERVPMTSLRRRIAERLVEAQRTAAILTTFNEVNCGELLAVRRRYRDRFRATHGVDLGLMSLFARACVLALRDVPVVNARIDGGDVVYHGHVHLGIAVATERGLVVPVIRHAHALGLAGLEQAIAALAARAREAKLAPDDLAGGTFSITNGGIFGSLLSTPILNPPQSAILGMHRIQDRPVAVDGQVVIRPMMYVALSYDHRLVDGQQAVTFLVRVKERLEDPLRVLLEL